MGGLGHKILRLNLRDLMEVSRRKDSTGLPMLVFFRVLLQAICVLVSSGDNHVHSHGFSLPMAVTTRALVQRHIELQSLIASCVSWEAPPICLTETSNQIAHPLPAPLLPTLPAVFPDSIMAPSVIHVHRQKLPIALHSFGTPMS